MDNTIIEIKQATKKIGNKIILDEISLNFERGMIHGIVGRNGVIATLMPKMTAPESAALRKSGRIIRKNFDSI